jgi:hypothetical protein
MAQGKSFCRDVDRRYKSRSYGDLPETGSLCPAGGRRWYNTTVGGGEIMSKPKVYLETTMFNKHINKQKTKRLVDLVNLTEGYKGIMICSPMEVIDYEFDE